MSGKHKFQFTLGEIEQHINALYDLEDSYADAQADGEDSSVHDAEFRQLKFYFECLADSLWKAGAFKSQEEARKHIHADIDVLQQVGGPDGLRPDDGTLDPDEIAAGLTALRNSNELIYQAPVCYLADRIDVDYTTGIGEAEFRLTSHYADLSLVKIHPELRTDKECERYLWIESSITAHRYDVVRPEIDFFLVSVMGMMEVMGLLQYTSWSRSGKNVSVGAKKRINSGSYIDMHSVRMSKHLLGLYNQPTDELDGARTSQSRLDAKLRFLGRALRDTTSAALAVRQACRTYLRAFESWNSGEVAMFLAITLEGLLLDKRQKDDLSARLQDSVAYWLGTSAPDRERIRKSIAELYKVRSRYVHNGEDAPPDFDMEVIRDLTRRVIRKELLTLEGLER